MTDKNETTEAAHCEIGPSTLPARAVCPCHDSAPGGADAESGTRSHKVVEAALAMLQGGEAAALPPGVTDDEKARGTWGAKEILRLRDETAPGAYIHTERRVRFHDDPYFLRAEAAAFMGKFGTVDAHWKSDDGETIYVADYKTYANADGEKSYLPQGMAYAVLLRSSVAPLAKRGTFFVVAGGDRGVARYDFNITDAAHDTAATIRRVEAVHPGGLFMTGAEARAKCGVPSVWCKHCAHAPDCPAISRAVAAVEDGGILTRPLAVRMAILPTLEAFAKRVREEVRAALDAGERVYDAASGIEYAFAERKGRAKLADLKGLAEAAVTYGVEPRDFAAAISISKTAVDALFKAVEERNGVKVSPRDRAARYMPYFTEPGPERYVKKIS